MATCHSLLRSTRTFDKILYRSCLLGSKIPLSGRCVSQRMMYCVNQDQKLFRKDIPKDPYGIFCIRPMSSQSQGSFLTDLKSSPAPALFLGFFGAVPFCGLAGMSIIFPEYMDLIVHAQQAYGACILSFLGAIHWGFALAKTSELKPDWGTLGYSVTPSLIAWMALLVNPLPALTTLCIGLAFALSKDLKTPHFPVWYYALRKALSTLAVGSVGLTAAVLYFH